MLFALLKNAVVVCLGNSHNKKGPDCLSKILKDSHFSTMEVFTMKSSDLA